MDYIFAPTISPDEIDCLRVIIGEHHTTFKELYPNCNIIPKLHYMVHYPDWILK